MKQHNSDIEKVISNKLDQHNPSASFDGIWSSYDKSKSRIFGYKKVVAIPIIVLIVFFALFTVGFASLSLIRNVDKTDYAFVDDSQIIGRWQAVDFVKELEDFSPEGKLLKHDLYLSELAFIKEGKVLFSIKKGNGNLADSPMTWTKDIIINKQEKTASKYQVKDIGGVTYMFYQWKNGDYIWRNAKPSYYVLKKVDSLDYSNFKIVQIEDKIDYPFIDDIQMIGKWTTVDFVEKINQFEPGVKSWPDDLFLTGFQLSSNGKLIASTSRNKSREGQITWTKGLILDKMNKTASKCEIKEMNGATYMFYEWKSGDYTLRGLQPQYYVLKKVE